MHALAAPGSARRVGFDLIRGIALAALIAAAGCAKPPAPPPPPKPTVLKATLTVSANSNPDASRRASPLVLRVYELKSSAAFDSADFLTLYEHDQATLGAEMAGREEFILRPGDKRPWEKTTGTDVRFVGVVGAFRDIDHARWKALVPVTSNANNVITITIEATTVSASVVAQ